MTLVLAAAAWLIFNSHLERFYPLPWLAADGLLGNSLFFLVSGYGVQSSLLNSFHGLPEFAGRRLIRLYPALIVVLAIQIALETQLHLSLPGHALGTFQEVVETFVWPTQYTYIRIIVPFYVLLWLVNLGSTRVLLVSTLLACAAYGALYVANLSTLGLGDHLSLGRLPDGIWWAYDWVLVSVGALLARAQVISKLTALRIASLLAVLGAYFAAKYVMVVRGEFVAVYPFLHAAVLAACVLSIITLCGPVFVAAAKRAPIVGGFLALSAALTLEIYLVHEPMTHMPVLYSIAFPANILVLAGVTILGALIVNYIAGAVRRAIEGAFSAHGPRGAG